MKGRKINPAELCKVFDCTPNELREQYRRDTELLRQLKEQAKQENRSIRGYTIAHLNGRIVVFKSIVNEINKPL